jgi:hypothetical protein
VDNPYRGLDQLGSKLKEIVGTLLIGSGLFLSVVLIMGLAWLMGTLHHSQSVAETHPQSKGVKVDPADGYTSQEADQMQNYYAVVAARVLGIFVLIGIGIVLAAIVGMIVVAIVRKGWQITDRIVSTGDGKHQGSLDELS